MKYYKGHPIHMNNGYEETYWPSHPCARSNGNVLVHVAVASEMLDGKLPDSAAVHHKDGNRCNNLPSNLMVFASNSDHLVYHSKMHDNSFLRKSLWYDGKMWHCDSPFGKNPRVCPVCGRMKTKSSNLCRCCASMRRRHVERPNREELKEQIRRQPFVQLARVYGVSDKAISKWCRQYGLPSHSREIASIPDSAWESL